MSSRDRILILGDAQDAHAAHIKRALEAVGARAYYWETSRFPTQMHLSWEPHSQEGFLMLEPTQKIQCNEIKSVYWRRFSDAQAPQLADSHQSFVATYDSASALSAFMKNLSARWVNSWEAYQFHREKPRQLAAVNQLGVTIPKTLISNNPAAIMEFVEKHSNCIFKPVYGGAHTQLVSQKHLESDRLRLALKISPVTIQEYIAGTNVRSYVIGSAVYSAEIRSLSIDFRCDEKAHLIPIELPEAIRSNCSKIADRLGLLWTAIDWRLTPEGQYVFLEANPSPMFIYFEKVTGFPITQELISLLLE